MDNDEFYLPLRYYDKLVQLLTIDEVMSAENLARAICRGLGSSVDHDWAFNRFVSTVPTHSAKRLKYVRRGGNLVDFIKKSFLKKFRVVAADFTYMQQLTAWMYNDQESLDTNLQKLKRLAALACVPEDSDLVMSTLTRAMPYNYKKGTHRICCRA